MKKLLAVDDDVLRAFLCLGGFAGLRTSEFQALKSDHIEEAEICVNAETRDERWVKIEPVFTRFWKGLPELPPTKRFYAHIKDAAGLDEWPSNCLRHSFGSYHLAKYEDAGKTAFQMGNSEAIVRSSYARAVRKAQGEAWWAIGADPSGKVIPIAA